MPDYKVRGIPRKEPDLILDMDEQGFAYTVGISFPPYPALWERCFRTDIRGGMMFVWNGTYWLSEQLFTLDLGWHEAVTGGAGVPQRYYALPVAGFAGIYFVSLSGEAYRSVATNDYDLSVYWGVGGSQLIGTSTTEYTGGGGTGWTLRNETISTPYRDISVQNSHVEVANTWAGSGTGTHFWEVALAYRLRAT